MVDSFLKTCVSSQLSYEPYKHLLFLSRPPFMCASQEGKGEWTNIIWIFRQLKGLWPSSFLKPGNSITFYVSFCQSRAMLSYMLQCVGWEKCLLWERPFFVRVAFLVTRQQNTGICHMGIFFLKKEMLPFCQKKTKQFDHLVPV